MKLVYLAGPISGLDYNGCNDWREEAVKKLDEWGIAGLSPMRYKNYLSDEKVISDEYNTTLSCSRGLTTRDRFDSMRCDIFLANLFGADSARRPIVTVIEKQGNPHEHSIVRELTCFRVETLEEGLYVARAILNPLLS